MLFSIYVFGINGQKSFFEFEKEIPKWFLNQKGTTHLLNTNKRLIKTLMISQPRGLMNEIASAGIEPTSSDYEPERIPFPQLAFSYDLNC